MVFLAPDGAPAPVCSLADVAQLVERNLAKVEVAGSSPVVRSRERPLGLPDLHVGRAQPSFVTHPCRVDREMCVTDRPPTGMMSQTP